MESSPSPPLPSGLERNSVKLNPSPSLRHGKPSRAGARGEGKKQHHRSCLRPGSVAEYIVSFIYLISVGIVEVCYVFLFILAAGGGRKGGHIMFAVLSGVR